MPEGQAKRPKRSEVKSDVRGRNVARFGRFPPSAIHFSVGFRWTRSGSSEDTESGCRDPFSNLHPGGDPLAVGPFPILFIGGFPLPENVHEDADRGESDDERRSTIAHEG